jgi:asparagine synthase (glutamine-hydrolysing)
MCGLAGFLDVDNHRNAQDLHELVTRMTVTLAHRGPDDQGTWVDPAAGIALGSRRLAIIDVSPDGHQPMRSASGRYTLAYNGEVYNAPELARALESAGRTPAWRGHSDTEIMLAAIEAWGFEAALGRFNGMFAFALWDEQDRQLHLVRDRLGIKPLYVHSVQDSVIFGSELRALRAHPDLAVRLDRAWLDQYLRGTPTRTVLTPYEDVHSVQPGTYLTFQAGHEPKERVYWSVVEQAERGHREPFPGGDAQAVDVLHSLLRESVRMQLVSDVPLGVLLSGGIDSATVLALAQAESDRTVRSFSIGFPEAGLDEAPDARAIAAHVGSDHTELYVTPSDLLQLIPTLPQLSDMPISDPSYVSNYFAYRLAKEHVTVALTGDGGDEVFGGYHRHRWLPRVWRAAGWVPAGVRAKGAAALDAVTPAAWDRIFSAVQPVIPARLRERTPGAKVQRLARWMACETPEEMYGVLASRWNDSSELVMGYDCASSLEPFHLQQLDGDFELVERVLTHELVTYLPDRQLTKVDRASMAVSVEARVPILDHRVVELALRLPPSLKVRRETGKRILREVLHQHVPEELFQRPKMGFQLPLTSWLRGPLRSWAEDLLQPDRIRRQGILNPASIQTTWSEHISGRRDRSDRLWPLLMLQSWLDAQSPGAGDAH